MLIHVYIIYLFKWEIFERQIIMLISVYIQLYILTNQFNSSSVYLSACRVRAFHPWKFKCHRTRDGWYFNMININDQSEKIHLKARTTEKHMLHQSNHQPMDSAIHHWTTHSKDFLCNEKMFLPVRKDHNAQRVELIKWYDMIWTRLHINIAKENCCFHTITIYNIFPEITETFLNFEKVNYCYKF